MVFPFHSPLRRLPGDQVPKFDILSLSCESALVFLNELGTAHAFETLEHKTLRIDCAFDHNPGPGVGRTRADPANHCRRLLWWIWG